jgi:hypothetical protein
MMRQIQKPFAGEKTSALGHADLHRVVKDMIKAEVAGDSSSLDFCKTLSTVMMKDFESHLSSRAVFIIIELLEQESTKQLIFKQAKAMLPAVKRIAAAEPKSAGLQILLKKLV